MGDHVPRVDRNPTDSYHPEALGWEPGINREVGLDKTIAYFDGWRVKSQRPA